MSVVKKEDFISWYDRTRPSYAGSVESQRMLPGQNAWDRPRGDRKSAEEVFAELRENTVQGMGFGKSFRPWTIKPDIMADTDRSQPWWGWEFETGWNSQEDRATAIAHAWDTYDGVTFDGEGEGSYPTEITFIPATQASFEDGTANAFKFMEWVDSNRDLTYNSGEVYIGTHLNMSSPGMDARNIGLLNSFVNNTLFWTGETTGDREYLFGRERLYGMAYTRSASTGHWLELKTFRTTYTMEQFNLYLRVAAAIQKTIDLFLAQTPEQQQKIINGNVGVRNMRAMVDDGAEPVLASTSELTYESSNARPRHTSRHY